MLLQKLNDTKFVMLNRRSLTAVCQKKNLRIKSIRNLHQLDNNSMHRPFRGRSIITELMHIPYKFHAKFFWHTAVYRLMTHIIKNKNV